MPGPLIPGSVSIDPNTQAVTSSGLAGALYASFASANASQLADLTVAPPDWLATNKVVNGSVVGKNDLASWVDTMTPANLATKQSWRDQANQLAVIVSYFLSVGYT